MTSWKSRSNHDLEDKIISKISSFPRKDRVWKGEKIKTDIHHLLIKVVILILIANRWAHFLLQR